MRYGTWNIRSLYGSGWLTTVATELSRYKIDTVCVQEVTWDNEDTNRKGLYFFIEKKTKIINWEKDFFVRHRTVSTVKRVESNHRISYMPVPVAARSKA